jgi:hypothetical protein
MEAVQMKDVLKYFMEEDGVPFVMICGIGMMLKLCVEKWASLVPMTFAQEHISVKEMAPSG